MTKTKDTPGRIIDNVVHRDLPVAMSHDENVRSAKEIARLEIEIRQLERERRESSETCTGRIKSHREEVLTLAHAIDTGTKTVPVECEVVRDFEQGLWKIVRRDTGDCVEQRALTPEELQVDLT
jgi:predicted neutral ceramidase superfamily lipid hydrolase